MRLGPGLYWALAGWEVRGGMEDFVFGAMSASHLAAVGGSRTRLPLPSVLIAFALARGSMCMAAKNVVKAAAILVWSASFCRLRQVVGSEGWMGPSGLVA